MRACVAGMRRLSITVSGLVAMALLAGCEGPADGEGDGGETAPLPALAKSFDGFMSVRSAAMSEDGDLFFGGGFNYEVDFGGGKLSSEPQGSLFVAQLDASGEHLWSGSTGSGDALAGVAVGPGGELYVTGSFRGSINFGSGKLTGRYDAYFAAFEPGGLSDYSFAAGGDANDRFESVATAPSGDVIVSGNFGDDADLGGGAAAEITDVQPVVAAYSADGEHLWEQRMLGGIAANSSVATDGAGNVFFSGQSYGNFVVGDVEAPAGPFVVKMSPSGAPLWVRAATGDFDVPDHRAMAVDRAGNVILAGIYLGEFSLGDIQVPTSPYVGGFVAKISAAGEPLFVRTFTLQSYGAAMEVAVADDGKIVLAMSPFGSVSFGDQTVGVENEQDIIVARFGPDGALLGAEALAGTASEYVQSVLVGPDGAPVVIGSFDAVLDIGETRLISESGSSTFIARL